MVIVVSMAKPFIVQVKDDKQRRIVIDKEAWNEEELKKGEYIEVIIKRVKIGENY